MHEYGFCWLPDRRIIKLEGADKDDFLQAIISQDVAKVTTSQSLWAALLSPQGRFLADFVVMRTENALLLDVADVFEVDVLKRLKMYRLRADVTITPLGEAWVVAASIDNIATLEGAGTTQHYEDGSLALVDVRSVKMGLRFVGEREMLEKRFSAAHFGEMSRDDYEIHRVKLGIPEGAQDAVVERSLLLELGYDLLGAVSFTKGCYVGQEVTARSKHRAQLRKGLMCVQSLSGDVLSEVETVLMADGEEVGEMRSHAGGYGLALMRLDKLEERPLAQVVIGNVVVALTKPFWQI